MSLPLDGHLQGAGNVQPLPPSQATDEAHAGYQAAHGSSIPDAAEGLPRDDFDESGPAAYSSTAGGIERLVWDSGELRGQEILPVKETPARRVCCGVQLSATSK